MVTCLDKSFYWVQFLFNSGPKTTRQFIDRPTKISIFENSCKFLFDNIKTYYSQMVKTAGRIDVELLLITYYGLTSLTYWVMSERQCEHDSYEYAYSDNECECISGIGMVVS